MRRPPRLMLLGATTFSGLALVGCGPDVEVVGQKCTNNSDGSVHVQGKVRNDGDDGAVTVRFWVKHYGGKTDDKTPFGGYEAPASGETALFGEDFEVSPMDGAVIDCGVEVLG